MVKYVESEGEWMALMNEEKLVVVDFTASWCGPCQMVAPHFEAMSKEYTNVIFVKVDVDNQDKIAQMCGVRAMPTFQFFKGGKKVDELMGADVATLKSKVAALA
eukprot:CAMPEP_0113404542 /NCGR_PEP_ID=MMETSP0013_2-20120614/18450_1 /TAXON_ID=2843 ORGANISM="Skeletonema costatum, Strain 1716" /NCGR_SAMPLE_ID=MMETSP0013_2 /ASSEMBLY_ACC=CAM_ASM_000158 /LENGTH=103 /DNA_ID=CAMNT_0000290161 /DNA_START=49 /DNA_END=360 /DNA_ORIENTATION=+ /assembly_acc=CAM_ASM_000158